MTLLKIARQQREIKRAELEKLGYTFSPIIEFGNLSVDELDDLSALNVGESTFIIIGDIGCDITRTA